MKNLYSIKNQEGCHYVSSEVKGRKNEVWVIIRAHRNATIIGLQMTLLASQVIGGGEAECSIIVYLGVKCKTFSTQGLGSQACEMLPVGWTCTWLQRVIMLIFRWHEVTLWGGGSKISVRFSSWLPCIVSDLSWTVFYMPFDAYSTLVR